MRIIHTSIPILNRGNIARTHTKKQACRPSELAFLFGGEFTMFHSSFSIMGCGFLKSLVRKKQFVRTGYDTLCIAKKQGIFEYY